MRLAADSGHPCRNQPPTYEDIIAVMAQAAVGDATARVAVPETVGPDDKVSSLALALNTLLNDLDSQRSSLPELALRGHMP